MIIFSIEFYYDFSRWYFFQMVKNNIYYSTIIIIFDVFKTYMRVIFSFIAIIFLTSCISVSKYNQQQDTPVDPLLLQKDVDIAYRDLQKFHPNLYWFIDKNVMDKKVDSLKGTIVSSMKPLDFYYKLSPVIGEIKEGHLRLRPNTKKLTKEEKQKYKKLKPLYSSLEYRILDNRMFVHKNKDSIQKIPVGAEILKIDGVPASEIINRYKKLANSDGNNTTFQKYALSKMWYSMLTIEKGLQDKTQYEIKHGNEIQNYTIKRDTIDRYKKDFAQKKKLKKTDKKKELTADKKKKTDSLALIKKEQNEIRYLKFLGKDSITAYLKIKHFAGFSKKFYKKEFQKLHDAKAENLIIDLRDNPGGSLHEIMDLYGYLTEKPYQLIKNPELNFNKANVHRDYFRNKSVVGKIVFAPFYPIVLVRNFASSYRGKDGKFYGKDKAAKTALPKENNFKGKIYLLINGGSFSASSIISAKLKNDQRAFLVGEETGGSNDGTVAGFYKTTKLPHSKLKLPIGLMLIQPNIAFNGSKKGVTPHQEILPTIDDIIQGKDPELDWILNDLAK